ncbi:MAG: tyrosine/phenylalanine carboxypeptidase domain-containing protein [bacterium]
MGSRIKQRLSFLQKASGILGINARNLLYISRFNSKANKKFADDKIFTKNYLSSRGLGTAKVITIIHNYKELVNFDPRSLPASFVIKPNRGYGGEGILVVKNKTTDGYVSLSEKKYKWNDIKRHITAIIDGKYAISGLSDQALVEERLISHEYFLQYSDEGLPDIRVIVFNYVPIIAMLRLPTEESEGKANLHLGAVGVGIDISTGKATYAVHHNKFVRNLPNGEKINEIHIPNWDEVLLMATRAQHASQIGFLAVDLALSDAGVKILELNARAGLAVQIANQVLLKSRLQKVADLKVPNPEKGVEISKTLFSSNIPAHKQDAKHDRPIIGLYEHVDILNTKYKNIVLKVDPHGNEIIIDNSLRDVGSNEGKIKIRIKGKRLVFPFKYDDFEGEKHKIVIGGKFLKEFLIDLNNTEVEKIKLINKKSEHIEEKIILNLDKKICRIESKINVSGAFRPLNLDREMNEFLRSRINSPRFFYRQTSVNLSQIKRELKALPKIINHPLAHLFLNKIKELILKIDLIESIDKEELHLFSSKLYGKADRKLYDKAVRYMHDNPIVEDESEILNCRAIVKELEKYLELFKMTKWKVRISKDRATDVAVSKSGIIFVRDGCSFSINRLKAVIFHEICTHIFRLENGKLQKYGIFEKGTSGYLATEEGLAIFNQKKINVALGEKDIWPAVRLIGIYLADEMTFAELFNHLKTDYNLTDHTAWVTCVKAKRGLVNTDKKISFTRDNVYFSGYLQVREYLKNDFGNRLRRMYMGKVGLNDLCLLERAMESNVKKPRHLPNYNIFSQL